MKRKSLISKWNQNKKQGILYLKTNCNYLNAKGTSHKTKKRNQHKYRNEFVHHIATLIRPKMWFWLGI
jgi:hypothetical protein